MFSLFEVIFFFFYESQVNRHPQEWHKSGCCNRFQEKPYYSSDLFCIGSRSLAGLTHWGRDKMDAILQTTFSSAFSWMKMFKFQLRYHWSLFLMVQLTIFQHWFRWWLGAVQATSHYLKQWWLFYRRIYASLGLNELTLWYLGTVEVVVQVCLSNRFHGMIPSALHVKVVSSKCHRTSLTISQYWLW